MRAIGTRRRRAAIALLPAVAVVAYRYRPVVEANTICYQEGCVVLWLAAAYALFLSAAGTFLATYLLLWFLAEYTVTVALRERSIEVARRDRPD